MQDTNIFKNTQRFISLIPVSCALILLL